VADNVSFQYHADILAAYPNIVGGIVVGTGLKNGPTPEPLLAAYQEEQQDTLDRIGETPLSEIPSLSAWRAAFRQFGANPTRHRSAAEALLRRLTKKGDIPSINMLVDVANLTSIRYGIPVASVDTRDVRGPITVHFSDGTERFTELGSDQPVAPEAGEVVFSDETKMVVARRWCWRQSAESASRPDTTDVIVTIEAQHEGGRTAVERALDDLLALLDQYAGGSYRHAILDVDAPAI
jgi:DNA/RNA-binding domain of Phe-tRNA-synthetase-like protein